jgi:hypothetical protein
LGEFSSQCALGDLPEWVGKRQPILGLRVKSCSVLCFELYQATL